MGVIRYFNDKDFELFIFDNYIFTQIKDGVIVNSHHNDMLNEIIRDNYSHKTMVYISNRVKSYSVNPLVYPKAATIPNIIAIAIIPKTSIMRRNAKYEKQFYEKPFEIFDNLTHAIYWAHGLILKEKSS